MHRMWVLSAMLAACAPVSSSIKRTEKLEKTREDQLSSRLESRADIETAGGDLSVRLIDRDFCTKVTVETYTRTEKRKRSVNKGVLVLEYVVGIGFGATGGFALAAPQTAAETISPDIPRDTAFAAGGAVAGIGGLALIAAIIDSTRGGTSTHTYPQETRKAGSPKEKLCAERPVVNRVIVVVADGRKADLNATDATGRTSASWQSLASALFEGTAPPAKAEVRSGDANGPVLGTIDLAAPRAAVVDRVWADVKAAGTARAAVAFRTRFPSERATEVDQLISSKGDDEMNAALTAALAGGDIAGARLLLDEWGAWLPNSTQRKLREPDVTAREIEVRVSTTIAAIDVALTSGEDVTDLGQITRAATLSLELQTFAATDPRTPLMVAKVAKARAARQKVLFERATAAEKSGALDQAIKLSDLAVEALPDPGSTKQQNELRKRIARRHAADSKKAIKAKDFALAAESMSRAEALMKDDREVVAARKALDKAAAAAEASIADAATRQRLKAEREAQAEALRLAREAEKKKAEEERLLRIAERKRKEDEAKALREAERAAKDAERLAKAEEKKKKEQAERDAREADRLQKEADRIAKLDDKKRKEEEAKAAKEAERLAKLDEKKRKDEEAKAAREAAIADKKRKDEEAKAAREAAIAEKKRKDEEAKAAKEAERLAKLAPDARKAEEARLAALADKEKKEQAALAEQKRKQQDARDAAEALRMQQEAERLAKLSPEERKVEEARLAKAAEERRKREEAAAANSGKRVATADVSLAGLWVTTAQSNAGRLTMLYQASATTGTLIVLGPTQRVLSRQTITWHAEGNQLTFAGGQGSLARSEGKLEGDTLTWSGHTWQRVRGRTTKVGTAAATASGTGASNATQGAGSGSNAK